MTLSKSSPRAKRRWLLLVATIAICTLGLSALVLATPGPDPTPIPAGYAGFTVTDQQGANDVPGQVDLTQMGRDDATASTYKLFWSWDSISSWTGTGQTGDACALFDTDTPGNTFIDFVVCVRVENFQASPTDVRILSPDGVFAFSCTDKKNDRCTNPTPVSFTASQVQTGALGGSPLSTTANLITHSDPFPAGESYNHDSTVEIHILKSFVPGTEVLVNVCSYPSAGNGGNNNPFDCIVSPGGGFLQIVKDAGAGVTSPNFTFDVNRTNTLLAQKTIAGSGTAALIPILVDPASGPNVVVTETNINSAWQLTTAGCTTPGTPPVATGTFDSANNRVTGVSIQSGTVTTCTFVDTLKQGTLTVTKVVTNDNGGTLGCADFSFAINGGTAVPFEADCTNVITVNAGNYSVTEPAVAGYATTYANTANANANCTSLPVAANGGATCTITNNDQAGSLTVTKVVTNDNGGTLGCADFSFAINGGTAVPFEADCTNVITVNAGNYSVTEPAVAGYATTYANTANANANCTSLPVSLNGGATCTITNNDQAGSLTVTKVVTNDNGGTLGCADFSFKVNGGTAVPFEADCTNVITVSAGNYSVVEPAVAGYATTYANTANANANCTSLPVSLNGGATCTITNNDDKAAPAGTTVQTWVLKDSIAITGIRAGAPNAASATVIFRLYGNATCTGAPIGSETDSSVVGGAAATSTGVSVTATGFYYWTAQYSGDDYNLGFTTTCGDEVTQIQAKDAFGGGRNNLILPT